MLLKSVDLFTGIGGFVLGLKGICTPMVYCDKDLGVQDALARMMADGRLPKAEVVDDVRSIDHIVKAVNGRTVDVLTAGFPCVGFSSVGLREGLDNEHSGLYRDTVKVIKALKPRMVLYENVAPVLTGNNHKDIKYIVRTMNAAGYDVRWTMCTGDEAGVPQLRQRWFCLCTRRSTSLKPIRVPPIPRLTPMPKHVTEERLSVQRYGMLGNAIIPAVARLAFFRLYSGFAIQTYADLKKASAVEFSRTLIGAAAKSPAEHGSMDTCVKVMRVSIVVADLVIDPKHYSTKSLGRGTLDVASKKIVEPFKRQFWPTPRTSCPGYSNYLTKRTAQDLPTVALFVSSVGGLKTPRTRQGQRLSINFVEWLMGYPRNHTK